MPLLSKFVSFWLNLFHRSQIEEDLDEEARSYIEMLTEEKIRSGSIPEEAQREAMIEFGGLDQVKEQVRDARVGVFLETLWQDLRYAFRQLLKNPGFTAVAVVTLALGIGGTTAIFSVIDGALLNPWPYADSDRLAMLVVHSKIRSGYAAVSPAEFLDYQKQTRVFDQVFGGLYEGVRVTGRDTPSVGPGLRATPNMFQVLGIPPLIGRTITEEDARVGAPPVVVLSYKIWQKTFGGDPDIIGKSLTLNHQPTTVIGVMPPRFKFFAYEGGGAPDYWLPGVFSRAEADDATNRSSVFGRLKPGATLAQASTEIEVLGKALAAVYPKSHPPGATFSFISLTQACVFEESRTALSLLMAAVGVLLLIACANVANLLLARATARRKEIAIRAALGASRGRVVRQFLVESLLLALAGAVLGCLVAWNGLDAFVAVIPTNYLPDEAVIHINAVALLFTLGVAMVSTMLFGLAPAMLSAWGDLQAPLKATGRGSGESSRHHQLRALLVVIEVALSLVLLSGAGLLTRSFLTLQQLKLGYNPENVFVVDADFLADRYNTHDKRLHIKLEFLRAMRAVPGVKAAALCSPSFGGLGWATHVQIDGEVIAEKHRVNVSHVGDGFFELLGIPIMQGRGISEEDLILSRKVAVINHSFARRYFGTKNPLGRQFQLVGWGSRDSPNPSFEVVGLSGDTVVTSRATFDHVGRSEPIAYLCYTIGITSWAQVIVRTSGMSASLEQSLRRAGAGLDNQALMDIASVDEVRKQIWFKIPRFLTTVFLSFACLGLILVTVGVFAVLSYAVSRRTQEIGLRMALGAEATDVRWMVMVSGLRWLLIGIGIGVPVSIALARILQNRIWGIKSADSLTLVAVSLLLVAVGLAACYFPARRATKVDPMVALRCE